MSAIWGIINFDKKEVSKEKANLMKGCFKECAIDRYEEMFDGNVYMGCGIQYVTKEAKYEKAPVKDDSYNFVADSIVDNRDELCKKLSIRNEETISDGEILEKAILTFGDKANDYARGVYAYVKYDKLKNEAVFADDPLGQRTVYYMIQGHSLYFASLMKPLKLFCDDIQPNEEWLGNCIGQYGYGMHFEEEQVPYANIFRIAPAMRIRAFETNGKVMLEKTVYWDPCAKRKKIKYKSDEEYKEHFRKLYDDCVKCVMRSAGETAILLSGGYDSSSVAAWAAKELEKRGKKLYSFTSVPMDGYVNDRERGENPDETDTILAMKKLYPNIEPTFMKLPDMDIWGDRTDYVETIEMPYKSPENLLWMYNGEKLAREKGAKIILCGTMGNATVSFGIFKAYLTKLVREFKWVTLIKEIEALHRVRGASRKVLVKFCWDIFIRKNEKTDKFNLDDACDLAFMYKDYALTSGAAEFMKSDFNNRVKMGKKFKVFYDSFFTYERMRTTGDIIQHTSLRTGVIMRDPTKDVRMIEFCRSLPLSQFIKKGRRRRLISVYMRDMLPPEVIDADYGVQSADAKMRILNQKEQVIKEWTYNYERFIDNPRINCKMALVNLNEKELSEMTVHELMRHIYTNVFLEFIESNFKK